MYGVGLVRGLSLTFKHFVETYFADLKWLGSKYTTPVFAERQGSETRGIFTVEYPDEKIAVPERFRFVPFLVVNNYDDPYAPGDDWCTSCGICAKVCPPQCIWIVRGTDPETGRPKPQPEAFYIDIDICMNCGYCAEYCPFDAIKMDHDYELASYDRTTHHIFDKKKLSKEFRYWENIAPNRVWDEAELRGHWEHKDVEKLAKKAGVTLPAPTEENMYRATTVLPTEQVAARPAAPGAPAIAASAPAAAAPVTGDPLAIMADEKQPLNIRAAATVKVKNDKDRKLTSNDRKLISAVQKLAKEQGTTIEDLAAGVGDLSNIQASAAPAPVADAPAPVAPAAAPAAIGAPKAAAMPTGDPLAIMMDGSLPLNIRAAAAVAVKNDKSRKLTSNDRKAISDVQKLAKAEGTTIEDLAAGVGSLEGVQASVPETAAPVAEPAAPVAATAVPVPEPSEAVAPAPAGLASSDDPAMAEINAAKDLEAKGKAKEIKLSGEDRKRIAQAKALAKEKGIDW